MEGKPPVPATAGALSKEMLTTYYLLFQTNLSFQLDVNYKKTVLTVLTALVKGDVKSRNGILGLQKILFFFFTAILKDFHSVGAITLYLLLAEKKTNTKTTKEKHM